MVYLHERDAVAASVNEGGLECGSLPVEAITARLEEGALERVLLYLGPDESGFLGPEEWRGAWAEFEEYVDAKLREQLQAWLDEAVANGEALYDTSTDRYRMIPTRRYRA